MRFRRDLMVVVSIATVMLLAVLIWLNPPTSRTLVLLAVAGPFAAYFSIGGLDLPLPASRQSPLRFLTWDCLDVVAIPLALAVPPPQAAALIAVVTVGTSRFLRPPGALSVRLYSAAVNALASLAAGYAGRALYGVVSGAPGDCLAVAVGVLIFEAVTLAGQMAIVPLQIGIRVLLLTASVGIGFVIADATGITVAYNKNAYVSAILLLLAAVLVTELMLRFGRASVALEERTGEREDILRTVVEAAEQQRRAVAADVHDGALQSVLASSALLSDIADGSLPVTPEALERAQTWLRVAAADLRSLVRGLVPEILAELGLEAAISRHAQLLTRSPAQSISVACQLPARPSPSVELVLYRAAHEALMNAAKHSSANHIAVDIAQENGEVVLSVVDDGQGGASLAQSERLDDDHVGLAMVRERVSLAGGTFELRERQGGGTELEVRLPTRSPMPDDSPSRAARMATWWATSLPAEGSSDR